MGRSFNVVDNAVNGASRELVRGWLSIVVLVGQKAVIIAEIRMDFLPLRRVTALCVLVCWGSNWQCEPGDSSVCSNPFCPYKRNQSFTAS